MISGICLKTLWLTPGVSHNVNYGLWAVMTYQCRFINCKKSTPLVVDVDNGGGYAWVGAGSTWKVLGSALNLKLL